MYANPPPAPPPKPGSHETSRISTPTTASQSQPQSHAQSPRPPPPPPPPLPPQQAYPSSSDEAQASSSTDPAQLPSAPPDPGPQWLPKFLEDKSKQDLTHILTTPSLIQALTHAPGTAHPSITASHAALQRALRENIDLAAQADEAARAEAQLRAETQARLLATHALERQWRAKQAEMDSALAPFAPARLYQRLALGVQEQEAVCEALEESFLEDHPHPHPHAHHAGVGSGEGDGGGGGGTAGGTVGEREAGEWVRRYREAKKLYYLRRERKERWDEGRVGGWR